MTIEADNNQSDVQTETVESEIGEVTAAEAEQDADTVSLADDAGEEIADIADNEDEDVADDEVDAADEDADEQS